MVGAVDAGIYGNADCAGGANEFRAELVLDSDKYCGDAVRGAGGDRRWTDDVAADAADAGG